MMHTYTPQLDRMTYMYNALTGALGERVTGCKVLHPPWHAGTSRGAGISAPWRPIPKKWTKQHSSQPSVQVGAPRQRPSPLQRWDTKAGRHSPQPAGIKNMAHASVPGNGACRGAHDAATLGTHGPPLDRQSPADAWARGDGLLRDLFKHLARIH